MRARYKVDRWGMVVAQIWGPSSGCMSVYRWCSFYTLAAARAWARHELLKGGGL